MSKKSQSGKHITKISASSKTASTPAPKAKDPAGNTVVARVSAAPSSRKHAKKSQKLSRKERKLAEKKQKIKSIDEKPLKSYFVLARPFVALGRYLRDSWRELAKVRWPSRGTTWKLTLAVLVYCAIVMVFVLLLDTLFTFLFNLLINH